MIELKKIHIGKLIKLRVDESDIDILRICNFFNKTEVEITSMYLYEHLNTDDLLKWSKLLKYDFFRIYSQHLIFYSPQSSSVNNIHTKLPRFRKNIYTKEIIDFIVGKIVKGEKSKEQVIKDYRIPKTTVLIYVYTIYQ